MNYSRHYALLVNRAKGRILNCYKETHHIIPKCIGGLDDNTNLVDLTAREHYIAHILLAKIHGGTLWHAVNLMGRLKKYSNRHYEQARLEHSRLLSEQNKRTKSKPKETRHYKCTHCGVDLKYTEFCHRTPKEHYYCSAKCRNTYISKFRDKPVGNRTTKADGRTSWNKGLPNSSAADNARKGASKLSAKVKGRTRLYKEDGSWTWQYPNSIDSNK